MKTPFILFHSFPQFSGSENRKNRQNLSVEPVEPVLISGSLRMALLVPCPMPVRASEPRSSTKTVDSSPNKFCFARPQGSWRDLSTDLSTDLSIIFWHFCLKYLKSIKSSNHPSNHPWHHLKSSMSHIEISERTSTYLNILNKWPFNDQNVKISEAIQPNTAEYSHQLSSASQNFDKPAWDCRETWFNSVSGANSAFWPS